MGWTNAGRMATRPWGRPNAIVGGGAGLSGTDLERICGTGGWCNTRKGSPSVFSNIGSSMYALSEYLAGWQYVKLHFLHFLFAFHRRMNQ